MDPYIRVATIASVLVCTAIAADSAYAQARRVRRAPLRSAIIVPGYYSPFFYDPWFSPFYGFGPYPYFGAYDVRGAVRIQVTPSDAEVFVDGYLAGRVDDFDGFFQRLNVTPGGHEIAVYKSGYRTTRQQVYIEPGKTLKVRQSLEPLRAGEQPDPRPVPHVAPPERPGSGGPPAPRGRGGRRGPDAEEQGQ